MHFTRILPLLLLTSLLLSGCGQEEPPATSLKLPMDRLEYDEVMVFNIVDQVRETFTKDQDSLVLELDKASLLDIAANREHNYVYLRPGEQLSLDTISSDPLVLAPVGERSKENEYLLRLAQTVKEDMSGLSLVDMSQSEPDSFLIKLHDKYSKSNALLAEIMADEALANDFKEAVSTYVLSLSGTHLMNYSFIYEYHHDTVPNLPDDFYEPVTSVDLTDDTWLAFNNSREFVSGWHAQDIDYSNFDSPAAYYEGIMQSAQQAYAGSLVGDYVEYDAMAAFINFGNGVDNGSAAIAAYQERVTNTYLLDQLASTIEPWLALKAGEPAPDFLVQDREGKEIRLADLAGKRVYIDVWATWCGPCIREIPALKELEKEYHDTNVQFVSISIDAEKDHEKWLNFIQERELGGLQLMADGAWKSDVVQSYNIKGIPRFLLIDEAGKIVSADAPRPSDPSIKDILTGEEG